MFLKTVMTSINYINHMKIKYIDLFSDIGGFRIAAEQVFNTHNVEHECVFASDIDIHCRDS